MPHCPILELSKKIKVIATNKIEINFSLALMYFFVGLAHSAPHGCSKCNKYFPGKIGGRNYGGFDEKTWESRNTVQHQRQMEEILNAASLTDRAKLESGFGTRYYSALACLPFFDTLHMSILDPMHNLVLSNFFNIKDNLFGLNLFYPE